MKRNEKILKTIESKRIPVLPFEVDIAKRALNRHIKHQDELGQLLNEAMSQSSETWHDNAPADAISNDSRNLAEAASAAIRIINESDVYSYEARPEDGVTLGSFVSARYHNKDEQSFFYITGATRELGERQDFLPQVDDLGIITAHSPIGRALLGVKEGGSVDFKTPRGRTMTIHVEGIRQLKPGE